MQLNQKVPLNQSHYQRGLMHKLFTAVSITTIKHFITTTFDETWSWPNRCV